jgi:5-methylcytosine-specific restriction endonuclease McrA
VIIPYSRLAPSVASFWLDNQKKYTAAQVAMAKECPHLMWVSPPNKGLKASLRKQVWDRGDGHCHYCRSPLTVRSFTVDHVLARVNGGTDDLENLVVACRSCNSSKGAR